MKKNRLFVRNSLNAPNSFLTKPFLTITNYNIMFYFCQSQINQIQYILFKLYFYNITSMTYPIQMSPQHLVRL